MRRKASLREVFTVSNCQIRFVFHCLAFTNFEREVRDGCHVDLQVQWSNEAKSVASSLLDGLARDSNGLRVACLAFTNNFEREFWDGCHVDLQVQWPNEAKSVASGLLHGLALVARKK